ncbi:MAG TPA: S24 family peptidase [Sphingomicrobium sp.]|jgi:phage repressor protein C with HTH and peptisase S24 domain|nr:S24 family peptidase [Sphingomicrobium sp.]
MTDADGSQIYLDLMRFKPEGWTPNAWATNAGVSRTVWSDMRRHGNPSRRTLEKLLTAAGSSLAEFEALRIGRKPSEASSTSALEDRAAPAWGRPSLPPLPLVATAMAGEWGGEGVELTELRGGEILDRVSRPQSLANDRTAYAATIVGDSMWPRFRPGRRVAISPKAPVAIGDDVLVKFKGGGSGGADLVLIKELVRRSAGGLKLRQFNPDVTFDVPSEEVAVVEKVLGELF